MQQTCQAVTNNHAGTAVSRFAIASFDVYPFTWSSTSSQSVDTLGCKILVYHVRTQGPTLDGGDISHPDP